MDLLHISQKIRQLRQAQGMTVEQLAARSGVSKGFISQVENFRTTPSLKVLQRIADALGVDMGGLFQNYRSVLPDLIAPILSGVLFLVTVTTYRFEIIPG